MTDEAKALVEECRLDAKAFRENTVYDSDGDPIRLIANADRLDQYADLIETQAREIERLRIALHEIDIEAANTIPPDGKDAAFAALFRIAQIINPFRLPRAALAGDSHDQ